jgi:ppGpp synthetase/RelA/SpoT-type nucleotidyltranferase
MGNSSYNSQKKTLNYSRKRVDKASRDIRHGCDGDLRKESIEIIQNFRETHLYPLLLIRNLLSGPVRRISKKAIVARRLKRLATIIDKLERPTLDGAKSNSIRLTRMQDIGGCRVILPSIRQLRKLQKNLISSKSVHKVIRTVDYLSHPKDSGYLGVHLVYNCYEGLEEDNEWKGTKIEVQLRTELQHAWATSLEIIDTLENLKLKTSTDGHQDWRRFFYIAGRLVAQEEQAFAIPETEIMPLINELRVLEEKLQVSKCMNKFSLAIKVVTHGSKTKVSGDITNHRGMFLIVMTRDNSNSLNVNLTPYDTNDSDSALRALEENELKQEVLIAVLVSASDVKKLEKAYPNYLGSTAKFINFISSKIKEPNSHLRKKTKKVAQAPMRIMPARRKTLLQRLFGV